MERKKGQEIAKIQTNSPWGKALESLRVDKKDYSVNQFERDGVMKRAAYRRALIGTEGPTFMSIDKLLKAMGCTWHDFAEAYEGQAFDPKAYATIPLYEVKAAAGVGAHVESERVIEDLAFRKDWIKSKLRANVKDLVCLTVTGSSMEPTIYPGDLVMLDKSQHTPKHDQIFVIRNDGEPLVKRLCMKNDGWIEIHSDNPDPKLKRPLVKRDALDIIGRVVWVAGKRG